MSHTSIAFSCNFFAIPLLLYSGSTKRYFIIDKKNCSFWAQITPAGLPLYLAKKNLAFSILARYDEEGGIARAGL